MIADSSDEERLVFERGPLLRGRRLYRGLANSLIAVQGFKVKRGQPSALLGGES
jgi:hypothetical protein